MKNWSSIVLLSGIIACTSPSPKEEAVLIKDLTKATAIIAEKNDTHFEKIKRYYLRDSSRSEIQRLHYQFSEIHRYKNNFLECLPENKESVEICTKEFVSKSLSLLTDKEQTLLKKTTYNSLLSDPALLQEVQASPILQYELALEVEIFIQEIYKLILKNPEQKKTDFNWEYFW